MVAELRRNVWLYRRSLGAHFRSTLEYEADFWIMSVAAIFSQGVGVAFLWAIFRAVPDINGWQFWDIVFIYSLVAIGEGISVLFGQGIWSLSVIVNLGGFDALLVRPFYPLLQVMSSQIGMNGLGNMALGGALLVSSITQIDVAWTPSVVAMAIVLLFSAPLVKVGLNIITNCAAFWLRTPWSMFAFAMHSFGELARYPITIYGPVIRLVLSVVLPYAFMSFYPAVSITSRGSAPWIGYFTPLVAAYCLYLGVRVFRLGVARYESAGH
ncbi:ABC transporter permease [Demequina lutea]|uniref:ABC-2 type transport system permease protein n=1 Tax=Demequina lutea TaxID=431489 RepID=A0A7Y9Z8L2_9MICO|nr:ABC-2 family transporter protein [Demequina lutea]NYI39963.1 ABC-2 type transport system permease protein [Demequina lutea]